MLGPDWYFYLTTRMYLLYHLVVHAAESKAPLQVYPRVGKQVRYCACQMQHSQAF